MKCSTVITNLFTEKKDFGNFQSDRNDKNQNLYKRNRKYLVAATSTKQENQTHEVFASLSSEKLQVEFYQTNKKL